MNDLSILSFDSSEEPCFEIEDKALFKNIDNASDCELEFVE
jgi:hypothetical protein